MSQQINRPSNSKPVAIPETRSAGPATATARAAPPANQEAIKEGQAGRRWERVQATARRSSTELNFGPGQRDKGHARSPEECQRRVEVSQPASQPAALVKKNQGGGFRMSDFRTQIEDFQHVNCEVQMTKTNAYDLTGNDFFPSRISKQ